MMARWSKHWCCAAAHSGAVTAASGSTLWHAANSAIDADERRSPHLMGSPLLRSAAGQSMREAGDHLFLIGSKGDLITAVGGHEDRCDFQAATQSPPARR